MPGGDGTGPLGTGPIGGRRGACRAGRGCQRAGYGFGRGMGGFMPFAVSKTGASSLKEEAQMLKERLVEIEKEISDAEK